MLVRRFVLWRRYVVAWREDEFDDPTEFRTFQPGRDDVVTQANLLGPDTEDIEDAGVTDE